ncbi:MAG: histidine kinase [Flavobacteriales bacterium]|nr:histidine kinase [Flavobacteriales bacterium]NNK81011.1 histidine kinase [Flavobacteriales bacterium]
MKAHVNSVKREDLKNVVVPEADVVVVFAKRDMMKDPEFMGLISNATDAEVIYVSTAGQIYENGVSDDLITLSSIKLEKSSLRTISFNVKDHNNYTEVGRELYNALDDPELKGMMVFSDGISVNGSDLRRGLESVNQGKIPIAGGLAGDSAEFESTLTGINEAIEGNVVGIGFYGDAISLGFGSRGGWQFKRHMNIISDSEANVLKEINGERALDFYKTKLNGKLQELPSDALKYPLMVSDIYSEQQLVRTVLSVDEEKGTMTFAGDMPLASSIQFLEATDEQLIQGAQSAALIANGHSNDCKPDIAFLISCVGRRLVMGEKVSEEVMVVRDILGYDVPITGFYSYGELSPSEVSQQCELLNQTMTIITLTENLS